MKTFMLAALLLASLSMGCAVMDRVADAGIDADRTLGRHQLWTKTTCNTNTRNGRTATFCSTN